jgi:replication factor A1
MVRSFGKADGKVFSAEFVDETGGEIRASFFNDAATKYLDAIQIGKVYTLSNGSVRIANKQYNNTNHRYELNFDRNANVEEVIGEAGLYKEHFNFIDLKAIQAKQLPCRADICGVITQFGNVTTLTAKDGRELVKRELTVADDTATTMSVTVWSEKAQLPDADFDGKPIIAISKVLVKEFGGERTASTSQSSSLLFNPEVP